MAKAKKRGWRGQIPFVKDSPAPDHWKGQPWWPEGGIIKGGQLGHEAGYVDGFYMADNFVFEDTLEFDHCERGRSAATFHFKRSDGSKVEFFMQETARLFPYFKDGKVTGRFTFVKRGANYSCSILDPSETE